MSEFYDLWINELRAFIQVTLKNIEMQVLLASSQMDYNSKTKAKQQFFILQWMHFHKFASFTTQFTNNAFECTFSHTHWLLLQNLLNGLHCFFFDM